MRIYVMNYFVNSFFFKFIYKLYKISRVAILIGINIKFERCLIIFIDEFWNDQKLF